MLVEVHSVLNVTFSGTMIRILTCWIFH